MTTTAAYSRPQVVLHWLIVLLVGAQLVTADAMEDFFDKAEDAGRLAGFPAEDAGAMAHALGGASILVLMLIRLGLRLAHGAPPPPASLSPVLQFAARATHYVFYLLLIALPLTGMTALYVTSEAGDVHALLKTVLLLFILAHVAAALTHAFILRDGVVRRMLSWT